MLYIIVFSANVLRALNKKVVIVEVFEPRLFQGMRVFVLDDHCQRYACIVAPTSDYDVFCHHFLYLCYECHWFSFKLIKSPLLRRFSLRHLKLMKLHCDA